MTASDPKRTLRAKKNRPKAVLLYTLFSKIVIVQKAADHQAYAASYSLHLNVALLEQSSL